MAPKVQHDRITPFPVTQDVFTDEALRGSIEGVEPVHITDANWGETRPRNAIRNRPNPDPDYGNPGPNAVKPLSPVQEESVMAGRAKKPVVDDQSENKGQERQESSGENRQQTGVSNRQLNGSTIRAATNGFRS